MSLGPITPIGYHAMRMRWCRAALLAFVRRWAMHLVVTAVVVAAGSSGAVASVQALCAWLVLPLFRAAVEPGWWVPATLLQALVGAALVWGVRPVLWPVRWAEAERALPIAPRETLRSDAVVAVLALGPLMVLYAVGAQALLAGDAEWLHPARGRALASLCLAAVGSLGFGVALLQWLRRPVGTGLESGRPGRRSGRVSAARRHAARARPEAVVGWVRALLWWPLWRGPAKRSGRALIAGTLALCAPSAGLLGWPTAAPWWLAAFAVLSLLVVTRVNALSCLELEPLGRACRQLPVSMLWLQRARELLSMSPLLLSASLLLACLPWTAARPLVFVAYVFACLLSGAIEVRAVPADAGTQASRWLFCIALMLALASEVMV